MTSRPNTRNLLLWIALAFAAGLFSATAQTGPQVEIEGDSVEMGFQREANLTPDEQTAWAEEKHGAVVETRDYVNRMLTHARQADRPDIVKINCLNNKLMEIDAQIGTFGDRQDALRESIGMGDNDRRRHEYRMLVVIYQKIQTLRAEAEACIGEEMGYMGASRVTVTVPDELPADDLTVIDIPDVYLDRPPPGSAYY